MANYKRKRRHPLRACRLCKRHKYMGNSEAAKKFRYRKIGARQNYLFAENG